MKHLVQNFDLGPDNAPYPQALSKSKFDAPCAWWPEEGSMTLASAVI